MPRRSRNTSDVCDKAGGDCESRRVRSSLVATSLLAAVIAAPGAAATIEQQYRPPPQLRLTVGAERPTPRLGLYCWHRRPGLPRGCRQPDYAPCRGAGAKRELQPPGCVPVLAHPGSPLAIDTRWAATSVRVFMRSSEPRRHWRVRSDRAAGHRRFLVRLPSRLRREVELTITVRYARPLTVHWSVPVKPTGTP